MAEKKRFFSLFKKAKTEKVTKKIVKLAGKEKVARKFCQGERKKMRKLVEKRISSCFFWCFIKQTALRAKKNEERNERIRDEIRRLKVDKGRKRKRSLRKTIGSQNSK